MTVTVDFLSSTRTGFFGQRTFKLPVFLTLLLTLCLVSIGKLGYDVRQERRSLSVASFDNLQWNLAQLEIELLRLQTAITPTNLDTADTIEEVRKRFDIFYSRVQTIHESDAFEGARRPESYSPELAVMDRFVAQGAAFFDQPSGIRPDQIRELAASTQLLYPAVRKFTLDCLDHFARSAEQKRLKISGLIHTLALLITGLVTFLLAGLIYMARLVIKGWQANEKASSAVSRQDAMITSSLDAILMVDCDGRIVEFNGAAEDIFGFSRAEAIGKDMGRLIVPERLRGRHNSAFKRFLATGETRVVDQGRIRLDALHKNGAEFPVEFSTSVAKDKGKTVFVSYLRDISRQVEDERKLRQAVEKAEASEKAKADLLTVMSHEMRTPLNGVLGCVRLLQKTNLTEKQKRYAQGMEISGDLLLRHLNDVLDLARAEAGSLELHNEPFEPRVLVEDLIKSQSPHAREKGNSLNLTHFDDAIGVVTGDFRRVQQCLLNLVGNAIKFTENGSVSVEVERVARDLVEFRVSDTGIGIAASKIETIFDDFVTVDTSYSRQSEGTGLGLAITRRISEALGGRVFVDSIEDEGSSFVIQLPLPESKRYLLSDETTKHSDVFETLNPLNILVVEDNETNRLVVREMLQDLGHTVTEANDGETGAHIAINKRFDLIFMDISMPGLDGIKAQSLIRKKGASSETPILALTAHVARDDRDRINNAGFTGILSKPIDESELAACILAVVKNEPGLNQRMSQRKSADQTLNLSIISSFIKNVGLHKTKSYISEFRDNLREIQRRLLEVPEISNREKRQVHSLAGQASFLGFELLASHLKKLEDCANRPVRGEVSRLSQQLVTTWEDTKSQLVDQELLIEG